MAERLREEAGVVETRVCMACSKEQLPDGIDKDACECADQHKTWELPIHLATKRGLRSSVQAIVNARPDQVDARSHNDSTPLHRAAYTGDLPMVQLLLQQAPFEHFLAAKADVRARTRSGWLAIHNASNQGHASRPEQQESFRQVCKVLAQQMVLVVELGRAPKANIEMAERALQEAAEIDWLLPPDPKTEQPSLMNCQ